MLGAEHICIIWMVIVLQNVNCQVRGRINPEIIQDSRLEPSVDGTYGFQYKTEDGISHASQGDSTGFIQGRYSYKDPTGLKVNINYFAGARNNQHSAQPQDGRSAQYNSAPPSYSSQPQQYYSDPEPYQASQDYQPRSRPQTSYTRSQNEANVNGRYTNTLPSTNEVYRT